MSVSTATVLARPTTTEEKFLTTEQAATLLQLSPITLRKWRKVKLGPDFCALADRTVRYRESAIEEWLERRTIYTQHSVRVHLVSLLERDGLI